MTPEWREAAKGIPVWVGCRAFSGRHDLVSLFVVKVGPNSTAGLINPAVPAGWPGGGASGALTSSWFPDLTDPDTRAAYDRRLALARGCPEEVADDGVKVYVDAAGLWIVAGRKSDEDEEGSWRDLVLLPTSTDPLFARALAWPADKRVSR